MKYENRIADDHSNEKCLENESTYEDSFDLKQE